MSPARTIFAAVVALAAVACTDAPVAVETDLDPVFARGGRGGRDAPGSPLNILDRVNVALADEGADYRAAVG